MSAKLKVDTLETVDGTGNITVNNQLTGLTSASMPTGSVLQVVSVTDSSTYTSTTSSSLVNIGGTSISITPSSTTSKILVMSSIPGMYHGNGGAQVIALGLKRDSTLLWKRERHGYKDSTGWDTINLSSTYLDSPSTTSSITYQFQISCSQSTVRANDYSSNSTERMLSVTLMEIAG